MESLGDESYLSKCALKNCTIIVSSVFVIVASTMHPTCRISHCVISLLCGHLVLLQELPSLKKLKQTKETPPCIYCFSLDKQSTVLVKISQKMTRKNPYYQSTTSSLIHEDLEHQKRAVKIVQTWHNASTKIECLRMGKGGKKRKEII